MRRNLNLPALMLQGALIFICLGGPATLLSLPALMLRSAYQATTRPCPRRVFREAILLSSGVMVLLLLIMSSRFPFAARSGVDHFTWLSLFLLGLLLSPFLCMFRAGLIMQGDRCMRLTASALPKEELARDYRSFLRGVLCRNLLEAMALAAMAVCGFFFAWNAVLVGLFGMAALYLLLDGVPFPATGDFVSLRARYQQALAGQQQLRRFLRWLWFAPVLVALHARLVQDGLATGRPLKAMLDCVAVAILCFLVAALNREHGGRMQEQIGLLDRMKERMLPDPNR